MKHVLEDACADHVASEPCHGGHGESRLGPGCPGDMDAELGMQRGLSWVARGWLGPGMAGRGVCQAGTQPCRGCAPGGRAGSPARHELSHPAVFLGFALPFPKRKFCLLKEMQLTRLPPCGGSRCASPMSHLHPMLTAPQKE